MSASSIEWTDDTWNPLRARVRVGGRTGTHCERISPGCANCYAARHNGRMLPNGGTGLDYTRESRDRVETVVDERILRQPLQGAGKSKWPRPRRIFVCSLTDLFGEWVTNEQIDRVFAVMGLASRHTFQVLTKRPRRMRWYVRSRPQEFAPGGRWPLPNVWLGVTAEDQQRADERIPLLLDTPAAVRFVSVEPMVAPVDLRPWLPVAPGLNMTPEWAASGRSLPNDRWINWVIAGGESGPGARECNVEWIRSVAAQCRSAGVPVFVKQLGAHVVDRNDRGLDGGEPDEWPSSTEFEHQGGRVHQGDDVRVRLVDRKGGAVDEWPSDLRVREFPRG